MQTERLNLLHIPGVDASRIELLRRMLPAAIAVPSDDPDDDDGDDDPFYRPLMGPKGATVAELRLALDALWEGIGRDVGKAVVLQDLLELARRAGADDAARVAELLAPASAGETPA